MDKLRCTACGLFKRQTETISVCEGIRAHDIEVILGTGRLDSRVVSLSTLEHAAPRALSLCLSDDNALLGPSSTSLSFYLFHLILLGIGLLNLSFNCYNRK